MTDAMAPARTGGALAVETLVSAGVDVVFGIHGAHVEAIFQSCFDAGVRIVDTRHEAAAGHAAEGYARVARRLGVAIATAGPGFTNIVTSMANAAVDRTPVLYIVGAAQLDDPESNSLQSGLDQLAVAAPIVKWAHRVARTADVSRLVAQAIRVATAAPTGPVYLEIPIDVMNGTADVPAFPAQCMADPAPAGLETIRQILRLLGEAARPLILAGGPVYRGGGEGALRSLAERLGIPVFADFEALGALPCSNALFGGTLWQLPRLDPAVQPDLVLALGVRFGWDAPGFRARLQPGVIHVEADAAEIGRLGPVVMGVVADPAATLVALCEAVDDDTVNDRGEWASAIRRQRDAMQLAIRRSPIGEGIHPVAAALAIRDAAGSDAVVVADGAFTKHWLDDVVAPERSGSYITHGRLGAMGIGHGMAIGAQVAAPDRPVVLVTGDGSAGFNIAEFDTMVRHDLPITVVIMNNKSWGASRVLQKVESGRLVGTGLGNARYDQVMSAFGGDGYRVAELSELDVVLRQAIASRRPACIEIAISDEDEIPPAMLSAMTR
ncbi:MAG: thiamine pyrophosphate-binding protein [Ilumatobacteraceae bacterium]